MDAKHTPRPWFFAGRLVIAEKYGSVCAVDDGQPDYVANAHLIAAAPELLAALYAALPFVEDMEKIRAAIAKAEGGQQ